MALEKNQKIIERLQIKTLSEFAGLIRVYFEEAEIVPEFFHLDQDIAAPMQAYAPPRAGIWLAREKKDAHALGLAALRPIANRTCELKYLFVTPENRRQGWGKVLLEHVIEAARKSEYLEILLSLRANQKAALVLYEHNGFKPCARYHQDKRAGIFLSYKFPTEV